MLLRLFLRRIYLIGACLFIGSIVSLSEVQTAVSPSPHFYQSYIVQGQQVDEVAQLVTQYHGIVTSRLNIIQGVGASLPESAVSALLAEPGITAITPNATVKTASTRAEDEPPVTADFSEVVGANAVWDEGITGTDVTIAVVDSGLKSTLHGINKATNDNNRVIVWQDFVGTEADPEDDNGHGTHVAGIAVNSDLGEDGAWNGIAPDVQLVSVRVLDEVGMGTYETVIQGIDWVVAHKEEYGIKVMNLSLVAPAQSPYWADPLNQAVMAAWASGITVVAAAGNSGPDPMTITVPGNNPYVITVGAFSDAFTPDDWTDDFITPFSATGPTLDGFVKPDLVAPGAHMVAPMLSSTRLAMDHPNYKIAGNYFSMAGTSQATAVVSGIAALVLAHNPTLTPDQVKYRIMYAAILWVDPETGDPLYSIWQQGSGRANAPDAVFSTATESANYGLDIQADLAGITHYQGYTCYDEATGEFCLYGNPKTWPGGFSTWAGGFSTWAGGFSTWAGGIGTWAGGFSTWAGGFSTWAGGFSTWAGSSEDWAGGYSTWAGGYNAWTGAEPWADRYGDPAFVAAYIAGESPDVSETTNSIPEWMEEIPWDHEFVFLPVVLR